MIAWSFFSVVIGSFCGTRQALLLIRAAFRHAAGTFAHSVPLSGMRQARFLKSKDKARILASIYIKSARWPRHKMSKNISIR